MPGDPNCECKGSGYVPDTRSMKKELPTPMLKNCPKCNRKPKKTKK